MTISDATWDKVREAWKAQIPEAYRCVGHDRGGNNHSYGAIIAAPPPVPILAKFFAYIFGPQHLAADQRRAIEMRAKCGRKGRRLDPTPTPTPRIRPSRAKPRPASDALSINDSALPSIADQLGGLV